MGPGIAAFLLALGLVSETVTVSSTPSPEEHGAFSLGSIVGPHGSDGLAATHIRSQEAVGSLD